MICQTYPVKEKIELILDSIRPALDMHGGDIELVKIDTRLKTIYVRFIGTCTHCAISEITLKHLIERQLKINVPQIKTVIAVA